MRKKYDTIYELIKQLAKHYAIREKKLWGMLLYPRWYGNTAVSAYFI